LLYTHNFSSLCLFSLLFFFFFLWCLLWALGVYLLTLRPSFLFCFGHQVEKQERCRSQLSPNVWRDTLELATPSSPSQRKVLFCFPSCERACPNTYELAGKKQVAVASSDGERKERKRMRTSLATPWTLATRTTRTKKRTSASHPNRKTSNCPLYSSALSKRSSSFLQSSTAQPQPQQLMHETSDVNTKMSQTPPLRLREIHNHNCRTSQYIRESGSFV